ncbi:type VI secretion protein IcmF/TssM N-terminal domain-containing protein [Pseudoalteromonas piratica]|uniref:Type VI secretion protein IcmF n=1 Tax=Pseudoalteromonas piratica TaxID=1348114 RepID=A0A0A7EET3_9GAMM|nr:type VI secretion protein IcmF/TssM N-terminal domain-containing protein [Pseudoalteromonas piratica]AIY65058.1 hypothetical protein OM33_07740 [Pseudoalteromonas piratica]
MNRSLIRLWSGATLITIAIVVAIVNAVMEYSLGLYVWCLAFALIGLLVILLPSINQRLMRGVHKRNQFKQYTLLIQGAQRKLKLDSNLYKTAWYLVVSEDGVSENFAQFNRVSLANIPAEIELYHVKGALIWHLKTSENQTRENFLAWLNYIRPKQALNGVLLLTDAFSLIQRSQKAKQDFLTDLKSQLETIFIRNGVKVPLHLFLCGINKLDGLAESLHLQADLDDLTFDLTDQGQTIQNTLSQACDALFKKLFISNIHQVSLQIDETFKRKQLLGSMQLQYLKLAIESFVSDLMDFNGLESPFKLTSFHFVESEFTEHRVNLATAHTLIEINQTMLPVLQDANLKPKVELTKTFAAQVLPLSDSAPTNKRRVIKHFMNQFMLFVTGISAFAFASWVGWKAFIYNESLHTEFSDVHAQYRESLNDSVYDITDPATIIEPLTVLRIAYAQFIKEQQKKPWFALPVLTSIERESHYQALYKEQLKLALEPVLMNYLEEELFVYLELEDYLKVINTKDVYESFAAAENQDVVINYMLHSLNDGGVLDEVEAQNFIALINDYYQLGYSKIKTNDELLAIVDSQLALQDPNQLMYKYVKQLPDFARLIDIRNALLGDEKVQKALFKVSGSSSSFLVPQLFTPAAMQQLSFVPESDFMKKLVKDNHGFFKTKPSSRELTRIGNYLKYRYINDYISFWRQYYQQIALADDLSLGPVLSALTEKQKSPLVQLYSTLRNYIVIPAVDIPSFEKTDSAAKAPKKLAAKAKKLDKVANAASGLLNPEQSLAIAQAQEHNEISEKIAQAFSQNTLISGDREVISNEYQILVKQLSALKLWLAKADNDVIPGLTYFNQLSSETRFNDFSGLWLTNFSEPPVRQLIDMVLAQSAAHIQDKVTAYLQQAWLDAVKLPYQKNVAPYYPFNRQGNDLPLSEMATYFAPQSSVNTFNETVLRNFVSVGNAKQLAIFDKNSVITLNSDVERFIDQYLKLQKRLYGRNNELQVSVNLSAKSMSPELAAFMLQTGDSALHYTHGPEIPKTVNWPKEFADSKLTLTLSDLNNQKKQFEYQGVWGIYRLISEYQTSTNSNVLRIPYNDKQSVDIAVKGINDKNNILNPHFFAQLEIPSTLLQ